MTNPEDSAIIITEQNCRSQKEREWEVRITVETSSRRQNAGIIKALDARIPLWNADSEASLLSVRDRTCFFTGHRDPYALPTGADEGDGTDVSHQLQIRIREYLEREVESLIYQGFSVFCCGGARGFDLLCAAVVLGCRERHPGLRLVLMLPCREQSRGWNDRDLALYRAVLERGEAYYLQHTYDRACMLRRNRCLVDHAAVGITWYNPERARSGTGMTVRYAESSGIPMIHLRPMVLSELFPSEEPSQPADGEQLRLPM